MADTDDLKLVALVLRGEPDASGALLSRIREEASAAPSAAPLLHLLGAVVIWEARADLAPDDLAELVAACAKRLVPVPEIAG